MVNFPKVGNQSILISRGKKINRFSSLQELPKTAISSSSDSQITPTQ